MLNAAASGFEAADDGSLEVLTASGDTYPADIVILGIGVKPETALAEMAGIKVGERGGIAVDDQMRTSVPTSSRSATPSRRPTASPVRTALSPWPGRRTVRAASRPT